MNPAVLLNQLAALLLGIAAVIIAYRLQKTYRYPFLSDYLMFLLLSAFWGFCLWTVPGILDSVRSVYGGRPVFSELPTVAKWFGFPFHLLQLYFLVLALAGLLRLPVGRTFKRVYLAGSMVILIVLFGALLDMLRGGSKDVFIFLHAVTTNAYLIFQALAFLGTGLLASRIAEPGRRRATARFSWLYLAGFVLYYVMTARVMPSIAASPWFFSAYHWPPLLALIIALRKGMLESLPAFPDEPDGVFAARFEWTERELDILRGVLAGRTNRQMAHDFFLSHQTVKNYVSRIYKKIGVNNRLELMNISRRAAADGRATPPGRE
ncbi:MAG: helix-turn-helix transcriptional regulator [Acidobacteriota bacterium]